MATDQPTARGYRIDHGLCPICGEEAAPYYLCNKHRMRQSISRRMDKFAERAS